MIIFNIFEIFDIRILFMFSIANDFTLFLFFSANIILFFIIIIFIYIDLQVILFLVNFITKNFLKIFMHCSGIGCITIYYTIRISNILNKLANYIKLTIVKD